MQVINFKQILLNLLLEKILNMTLYSFKECLALETKLLCQDDILLECFAESCVKKTSWCCYPSYLSQSLCYLVIDFKKVMCASCLIYHLNLSIWHINHISGQ